MLALTLLAAAMQADPTLEWLPGADALGSPRASLFEAELAPHVLNEQPRHRDCAQRGACFGLACWLAIDQ